MRWFDNAHPDGLFIDCRREMGEIEKTQWKAAEDVRPLCPRCNKRMNLHPDLTETPWRSMNVNGVDWARRTDIRIAVLARHRVTLDAMGKRYICGRYACTKKQ